MDRIAASVTAAIAACAATGCYWPVPKCQEEPTSLEVSVRQLQLAGGDTFVVDGKTYASCADFCARQPNVTQVRACEAPEARTAVGVVGVAYWRVSCEVDTMVCEDPTIATMGSGRPFEGFERARAIGSVAAWLAEMARLEAASVAAFDRLARELTAHRAPPALIDAARRAERDEIRHARIARALARRWGASPTAVSSPPLAVRDLASLAEENAVEGCAGETLGAIVAAYQARHATDPRVRAALAPIARDEAGHAVLAWQVHAWASRRLGGGARTALARALESALRDACIPHGWSELGLPSRPAAALLRRDAQARLRGLARAINDR